jgi:hypothetical protein
MVNISTFISMLSQGWSSVIIAFTLYTIAPYSTSSETHRSVLVTLKNGLRESIILLLFKDATEYHRRFRSQVSSEW